MRILLGMPRYTSKVHLQAATAFYHPTVEGTQLKVTLVDAGGSLLANSFNQLWAAARNGFEAGEIDGFAMIHADIEAEAGWLDVLHREMLASGADIISTVVPIKDDRGLSSTAVDDTGDPWLVRRLTIREALKLPLTFGDAAVGGPLLLNTGLWLCKLGPWCLDVHFRIHDAIRREGNRWIARVQPEDWDFSRQLRAKGLSLKATRAVKVNHFGEAGFPNFAAWGWDEDEQNGPNAKWRKQPERASA